MISVRHRNHHFFLQFNNQTEFIAKGMEARYRVPRTARPTNRADLPKKINCCIGTLPHWPLFNCDIELTAKSAKKAQRPQRFAQGKFWGGKSAHLLIS